MISAWASDRARIRGPFVIVGALVSATGSLIVGYGKGNGVRYFGSFLAIIGPSKFHELIIALSVQVQAASRTFPPYANFFFPIDAR